MQPKSTPAQLTILFIQILKWKSEKFAKYLDRFEYFGIENREHMIEAPDKFVRDWFKREYKDILDKVLGKWIMTAL